VLVWLNFQQKLIYNNATNFYFVLMPAARFLGISPIRKTQRFVYDFESGKYSRTSGSSMAAPLQV